MSDLSDAIEHLAASIESLVAIEERKLGAGTRVLEVAARQQRELEGRPKVELVESDPGPA